MTHGQLQDLLIKKEILNREIRLACKVLFVEGSTIHWLSGDVRKSGKVIQISSGDLMILVEVGEVGATVWVNPERVVA